jgi:hypothetical protein
MPTFPLISKLWRVRIPEEQRAGQLNSKPTKGSCSGPLAYSPECGEGGFSEGRIQDRA